MWDTGYFFLKIELLKAHTYKNSIPTKLGTETGEYGQVHRLEAGLFFGGC